MNRPHAIRRLAEEEFDVLIIGGGATGTGCALDAQVRGFKTALIEQEDFAAGASSRSTKLIHGGVRYLEKAAREIDVSQVKFVREALLERAVMIRNAPYLAGQLPLVIPVYSSFDKLYYAVGLHIYDLLAGRHNLAPSRRLDRAATLDLLPSLRDDAHLKGGILYWDGQFDDARYALMLARTASDNGAVVANHVRLLRFDAQDGILSHAVVRDEQTGREIRIRARAFINATGAFADEIRLLANPDARSRLKPTKGIHLVLSREVMPGNTALLIPKTDDGRVIFAIPWHEGVLVGTTDSEYEAVTNAPPVLDEEIVYLLDHLNRYLARPLVPQDVLASFAGLRPLLNSNNEEETKFLSRGHDVEIDRSGLISVLGGKWTTYRLMAKDAVDALALWLGVEMPECRTDNFPLYGTAPDGSDAIPQLQARTGWSLEVCSHLYHSYGVAADAIVEIAKQQPSLAVPLAEGYPHLAAEVVYAAREEMACTADDVLARRLRLQTVSAEAALRARPAVEALLAAMDESAGQ